MDNYLRWNTKMIINILFRSIIQLKPIDLKLSYLIVVKLNDLLIFNSTQQSYDYFKIMCPKLGNLLLILGIKILK